MLSFLYSCLFSYSLRLFRLLFFFFLMLPPPPRSTLFPYTTLFRSLHRLARARRCPAALHGASAVQFPDRKITRLNSSHVEISYAVFCLKKKKKKIPHLHTSQKHLKKDQTPTT